MLEYYKLAEAKSSSPQKILGIFLGLCVLIRFYLNNIILPSIDFFIFAFTLFIFLFELFRNKENPLQNLSTTFFGMLYVAGSFGTLLALREMKNAELIIAIFISIWKNENMT